MIPPEIAESIVPQIADGTHDAAVLSHVCGVDFQFQVDLFDGNPYLVTNAHLKTWRTKIEKVAALAGENCFSYNTLEGDCDGVYYPNADNTLAILFAPGSFLEHNEVDGKRLFLLLSESKSILTGSNSTEGMALIEKHRKTATAKSVVTIDKKWQNWILPDKIE